MTRRLGLRGRTDFPVLARAGALATSYRGVELSATGIVLDRGRELAARDEALTYELELRLPERVRPIRALARRVWSRGSLVALKFVRLGDADRLSLAEHLDVVQLGGGELC